MRSYFGKQYARSFSIHSTIVVIEGRFSSWLEKLILDDQLNRGKHTGIAIVLRYAFVIASPTEREEMIEVIEEKKNAPIAGEARSLYEAILFDGMEPLAIVETFLKED